MKSHENGCDTGMLQRSVRAIFFAEEGPGLTSVPVTFVFDWHVPLKHIGQAGSDMNVAKLADRFTLGFSLAERTVVLSPEQICIEPDIEGQGGELLTDGNGQISADLMDEVTRKLGMAGRRISALQVRIGPAKGMLVRDAALKSKVILRKSQVKYGDKSYFEECEPCQRTIEVVDHVLADGPCRTAKLNYQLILVLEASWVPPQVILELEQKVRLEMESRLRSGTLLEDGFLPRSDATHTSDLCSNIWGMHAAGMKPTEDSYFFRCVSRYAEGPLTQIKKGLPCPDTFRLKMVSDFSKCLKQGTMSVWVPGHGFLLGPHIVTRIPCMHPRDIVVLEGVDMLQFCPSSAFENLAVMSADPSHWCSPASHMSGGDYDGDDAVVIGYRPIVDAVMAVPIARDKCAKSSHGAARMVADIIAPFQTNEARLEALQDAVHQQCLLAAKSSDTVGKLHKLWVKNADHELSSSRGFSQKMAHLVDLYEAALDAPKNGFRTEAQALGDFDAAKLPAWAKEHWPQGKDPTVESQSAMAQLCAIPVKDAFDSLKPNPTLGCSIMETVQRHTERLTLDVKAKIRIIWETRRAEFQSSKKGPKDLKSRKRPVADAFETVPELIQQARMKWTCDAHAINISSLDFARFVYKDTTGDPTCWELCFDELLQVAAEQKSSKVSGQPSVFSVARGLQHVALRSIQTTEKSLGLAISARPELTRAAKVMKNLSMRGSADGGELLEATRQEPRILPVRDIRFTHADVSSLFKDGRSIESLVDELQSGKDPLDMEFSLDVVRFEGQWYSLRNRRLWALHEHRKRCLAQGKSGNVLVKTTELSLSERAVCSKFFESLSTENEGRSATVRISSRVPSG